MTAKTDEPSADASTARLRVVRPEERDAGTGIVKRCNIVAYNNRPPPVAMPSSAPRILCRFL